MRHVPSLCTILRAASFAAAGTALWTAPAAAQSFEACIDNLRSSVTAAGVSTDLAHRALDLQQPDERILRLSEVQPEFKTPIWDYFAFLVDEQRVADGQAMMRQHELHLAIF